MHAGLVCLITGYLFSQFYRSFLAVLTPLLEIELMASKQELASASGWWFFAFGAMQIPVGVALDRIGPRRTTAVLLGLAAFGALFFAAAQTPLHLKIAMALIGAGCAPILVGTYFILAREFAPARFGLLASLTIGLGSLGDIAASLPFSLLVSLAGWRESLTGIAVLTFAMALAVYLVVRDPPRAQEGGHGSLLSVLRIAPLWPVLALMAICYAPPAAVRGLWLGPYFHDIHGLSATGIGAASLVMGLALVLGSLMIGPLSRLIGSLRRTAFLANTGMMLCLAALWVLPGASPAAAVVLFAGVGLFGTSFPIVTAHARGFIPAHLLGRGITFVNLIGITSVGVSQEITGRIFEAGQKSGLAPETGFSHVFGFFALISLAGLGVYLFSREAREPR